MLNITEVIEQLNAINNKMSFFIECTSLWVQLMCIITSWSRLRLSLSMPEGATLLYIFFCKHMQVNFWMNSILHSKHVKHVENKLPFKFIFLRSYKHDFKFYGVNFSISQGNLCKHNAKLFETSRNRFIIDNFVSFCIISVTKAKSNF